MRLFRRCLPAWSLLLPAIVSLTDVGCGGRSGTPSMAPIEVSLNPAMFTVRQNGTATSVQILIRSTSETALVSFAGMPGGVQVMYAASDTNPSGLLTFKGTRQAAAGTYMPIVTVNSAGQAASSGFTLTVTP